MGVDFHANLTHYFHLDLTHPDSALHSPFFVTQYSASPMLSLYADIKALNEGQPFFGRHPYLTLYFYVG